MSEQLPSVMKSPLRLQGEARTRVKVEEDKEVDECLEDRMLKSGRRQD